MHLENATKNIRETIPIEAGSGAVAGRDPATLQLQLKVVGRSVDLIFMVLKSYSTERLMPVLLENSA